jgi:short-subunit dehydrogenase
MNILITGASQGIGAELAKQLAAHHNLGLAARNLEKLEKLKLEIQLQFPQCKISLSTMDVTDPVQVKKGFYHIVDELGGIDSCVINAGMECHAQFGEGKLAELHQTADTNYKAVITQADTALEYFKARAESGQVVFMSSISAFHGMPENMCVYASTKAGVRSLAQGLACQYSGTNIHISWFNPGYVRTDLFSDGRKLWFSCSTERAVRAMVRGIEKKRREKTLPFWPWSIVRFIMPYMPNWVLKPFF